MSEFLDYGDSAAMRQRIPELEAEVERLRDANVSIRRDLQASWEEKAALHEENERLREYESKSHHDLGRLRRIEEAARRSTGPGWLENLRAALDDQTADAAIGWDHSDGQTNEEKA